MKASKEQIRNLGGLKDRADFLRVQGAGVKWVAKGLIIQAAPNGGETVRFGLTASKKLSKSAVRRNRIRRRLRAAACDVLPLYAKPGSDIVLIGRTESADRPYDQLCQDLRWCLEKTGFTREATP